MAPPSELPSKGAQNSSSSRFSSQRIHTVPILPPPRPGPSDLQSVSRSTQQATPSQARASSPEGDNSESAASETSAIDPPSPQPSASSMEGATAVPLNAATSAPAKKMSRQPPVPPMEETPLGVLKSATDKIGMHLLDASLVSPNLISSPAHHFDTQL
jgi:hypothetical protein